MDIGKKVSEIAITSLVTIIAAIIGVWLTYYLQTRDPYEGDVHAALEEILSENIKQRIQAIRSLESVAKGSDKFHNIILETLTTFIRKNSSWKPGVFHTSVKKDIQAALTLLGKIPKRDDKGNLIRVDLHNVDISGANLENANLEGVILWGSNLRKVVLARANLQEADLGGVDFTEASLEMANLQGSFLWMSAPLEPRRPCVFDRARLGGAKLEGAHLEAAILTDAIDLSEAQVRSAIINENTQLPYNLRKSNPPMQPTH